MKLDPVFLVAPRPKPPSMSTRRAFLGMGAAFVAGGAIGSACGYAAGVANAKAVDASATEELQPSGDADLDEVRRLAVKAPIEELMADSLAFLGAVTQDHSEDKIAWRGVARISQYVIDHPEVGDRRLLAGVMVQMIEKAPPSIRSDYLPWVPRLQAVR